ncbi:transcription initiation factor IIF, beta subunit-domain-containing protein [Trametes punicea]|nr:transcription initiation factor IIF, beta subunit-domain-containing protein [Trametes punicea]
MRFAAFDEYSPDLHGRYQDWEPMATSSEESDYEDDDLMQVEPGDGKLLIVKIPKHLMERWSAIDEDGAHLATIRVYPPPRAAAPYRAAATKPRIVLTLPPEPDDDGLGPDEYEMDMSSADPAAPFNEYVVAEYDSAIARYFEHPPAPGAKVHGARKDRTKSKKNRRTRRVALAGMVTHHCTLRSVLSERLRQRVHARTVEANTPKRRTVYLGHVGLSRPTAAGADSVRRPFLFTAGCKGTRAPVDRMTRVSRPALLDMLFRLFEERKRWTLKALRERTQQPEAYLKEVMLEIAFLHRTGEYRGTWEASARYTSINAESATTTAPTSVQLFGEDQDVEADNDSDLEEVI